MSQLLGLYSMGMTLGENVTVYLVTGAATLTTRAVETHLAARASPSKGSRAALTASRGTRRRGGSLPTALRGAGRPPAVSSECFSSLWADIGAASASSAAAADSHSGS